MTHKMGLAKITPISKAVTLKVTWDYTAPQTAHTEYSETKTPGTTGSVTASTSFDDATSSRLCNSSGYWTIVKATDENNCIAVSLGTITTDADNWTQSVTDIGYGKYKNYDVTSSRTFQQFEANFPYNSSKTYYQITLPWHGTFTATLYGAQGGYDGSQAGGYGGCVVASKYFPDNTVLYVCVGGMGATSASGSGGGYNGGGNAGSVGGAGGGGGGTDIRNSTVNNSRTLVAGGGGGGTASVYGGYDGGAAGSGNNGTLFQGSKGGDSSNGGGGGGGGYYGGTGGLSRTRKAYGGSNYIGAGWSASINGSSSHTGNGTAQISM